MAAFEYTAIDKNGRQRKGVLEGDSSRQVRQALRDRDLMPMAVEPAAARRGETAVRPDRQASVSTVRRAMSPLEMALFTRQLSTLIAAGLPVEESLYTIARQTTSAASPRW